MKTLEGFSWSLGIYADLTKDLKQKNKKQLSL